MTTSDKQHHPKRMLGSGFTLAVIVGGTIGLGILRTPGEVAAVVPDPVRFVSLWVLSGLFILLSAVVVAELVGMTPRSWWRYPGLCTGPLCALDRNDSIRRRPPDQASYTRRDMNPQRPGYDLLIYGFTNLPPSQGGSHEDTAASSF
jgi:hypothetical protein